MIALLLVAMQMVTAPSSAGKLYYVDLTIFGGDGITAKDLESKTKPVALTDNEVVRILRYLETKGESIPDREFDQSKIHFALDTSSKRFHVDYYGNVRTGERYWAMKPREFLELYFFAEWLDKGRKGPAPIPVRVPRLSQPPP